MNSFDSLDQLYQFKQKNPNEFSDIFSVLSNDDIYQYDIFSYCSIRYLIDISIGSRIELLAMTTGGRTVNESPKECYIEYGADKDPKTEEKQKCWERYLSTKGIKETIILMNDDNLPRINLNDQ